MYANPTQDRLHKENGSREQAYVGRIKEVNCTLHMVTEINPDAWKIANELDKERADGALRG